MVLRGFETSEKSSEQGNGPSEGHGGLHGLDVHEYIFSWDTTSLPSYIPSSTYQAREAIARVRQDE